MKERTVLIGLILFAAVALACNPLATLSGNNGTPTAAATRTPAVAMPTALPPTSSPTPVATAVPTLAKATASSPSGGAVPTPKRIQFQAGGTSATIQGNLGTNGMDRYVLRALAGQTLKIDLASKQANMLFQVNGADGNVLKSFGAGASSWSIQLPTTQDYVIGITTEDGSAASYTLTVTIPPR